ncbi:MAG: hypothetical protein ABW067_09855 [Rhizobacter sp.]
MSGSPKPAGTVTTGFRAPVEDQRWDRQPIYRIVEVSRDGEGRLRREGRVWHNDLDMLRKFGRAVAANTSSHRVMITDSLGEVIEELPVATAEARQSAWDTWGGLELPPAPPRRPRPVPAPKPAPAPSISPRWAEDTPAASPASAAPAPVQAAATPPRDIPQLPIDQAEAPALDAQVNPVPEHEQTLP